MNRLIRLSLLIAALVVLALLGLAWEITRFAEVDQTRPADAAIVLGAGAWGGRPSPVLRERLNHAIALYQDGFVEKLIFTGGVGRRSSLSEGEVSRQYALARGVDPADILVEDTSTNTIENLNGARAVAVETGLESFLLVSTPFHMKRAVWIASDLEMKAYSSPTRSIRWIRPATKRRALVQETVSFLVHAWRRTTPDYREIVLNSAS